MQTEGKRLYLCFFSGLPGVGKTTLLEGLQNHYSKQGTGIEIASSDECRSLAIQGEIEAKGLLRGDLSEAELYQLELDLGKQTKERLVLHVKEKLARLGKGGCKRNIFILDKNFSDQALVDQVFKAAKELFLENSITAVVFVADDVSLIRQSPFYPFSFDTVIISLARSLNRGSHPTMNNGYRHSIMSHINCLLRSCADDFDAKYPQSKFHYLQVNYYDEKRLRDLEKDSEGKKAFSKLNSILLPIIRGEAKMEHHFEEIYNQCKVCQSFTREPYLDVDNFIEKLDIALEDWSN